MPPMAGAGVGPSGRAAGAPIRDDLLEIVPEPFYVVKTTDDTGVNCVNAGC